MKREDLPERGPSGLPPCAEQFIAAVVRKMGYRKRIRQEVREELTAHFEDELRDATDPVEREKGAKRLIEEFGDPGLLAVLCRRAKKRCRPLWAKVAICSLQAIGVVIVLLSLYIAWFISGKPNVKIDYLTTWSRVSRPEIAEQDNAWPHYKQAIALLIEADRELQQMPAFHNPDDAECRNFAGLSSDTQDAIEKWTEANRSAWDQFAIAAGKPYLAVPYQNHRDAVDPWLCHVAIPDLAAIERLCRVGVWRSRIDLERGRTAEALEDCLVVSRAGRHWQRSGTPIEQLAGLRISRIGHEAILRIVASRSLGPAELSNLQRKVTLIHPAGYPLVDAEFERLVALDTVQHVFTSGGPGGGHMVPSTSAGLVETAMEEICPGAARNPLLRTILSVVHAGRTRTLATVERVFDRYRELSFLTPWERRTRGRGTVDQMIESLPRYRYALVRSLIPSLDRMAESRFRGRTLYQATLAILALQRYRAEMGAYPPSLNELMRMGYLDAMPTDPYTDKPLLYKVSGDAFSLYSVGPDFEDDGGTRSVNDQGRSRMWGDVGDTVFWPVNP